MGSSTTNSDLFGASNAIFETGNNTNGVVWDVDRGTNALYAYDASTGYSNMLYNSGQAPNGRDSLGSAVKFQVATVANGARSRAR